MILQSILDNQSNNSSVDLQMRSSLTFLSGCQKSIVPFSVFFIKLQENLLLKHNNNKYIEWKSIPYYLLQLSYFSCFSFYLQVMTLLSYI